MARRRSRSLEPSGANKWASIGANFNERVMREPRLTVSAGAPKWRRPAGAQSTAPGARQPRAPRKAASEGQAANQDKCGPSLSPSPSAAPHTPLSPKLERTRGSRLGAIWRSLLPLSRPPLPPHKVDDYCVFIARSYCGAQFQPARSAPHFRSPHLSVARAADKRLKLKQQQQQQQRHSLT